MTAPYRSEAFAGAGTLRHVMIAGGGIGGLCLAQGLQRAGIRATVYERERALGDRLQGYRVHISPTGSRALHACLPPDLFDAFVRTCGISSDRLRMYTPDMRTLLTMDAGMFETGDPVARHRAASRITLRQVLMSGLERIEFGKMFTHYEERDGSVVAHFADGTSAQGDVLVGADGGGSRVRRQLLPHAERVDTGVVGIGGKVFLDEARAFIAPALLEGVSMVSTPGLRLFVALQDHGATPPGGPDGIGGDDPTAPATSLFDNTRSYLMWALSARRETFGLPEAVETVDAEMLRATAARAIADWAPAFRDLVRLADPATISSIRIRTSQPVAPWQTGRVTLLGDAIHAMTPYRGIGANVALKDAVRLREALIAAHHGARDLVEAVADYERGMIDYGFRAVRNSLGAMRQALDSGPVRQAMLRGVLRVIDRVPALKRRMAQGLADV